MDLKSILLLGGAGYFAAVARDIPLRLWRLFMQKISTSISVNSDDHTSYEKIEGFILSQNFPCFNKHIHYDYEYGWNHDDDRPIKRSYKTIGHDTYFQCVDTGTYMKVTKNVVNERTSITKTKIEFIGIHKKKWYDKVIEAASKQDKSNLMSVYPFKDSRRCIQQPKRSFDTIFNSEKELVIEHVKKWQSNKDYYESNGIINKTGILLYGEPGTGKSTMFRALASYLNYNLHVISLKAYENEDELINRVSSIRANSVVLFEDIDCVVQNRDDNKSNKSDIFGTLLNMIDGSLSPSNVVFAATTNHFDKLDSALTREGRFDLKIEVKEMTATDAYNMAKHYGISMEFNGGERYNPTLLQNKIFKELE